MRPMPAPLGLYIHIPFCKSKCVYCDFYSLPRSESRMDDYTDALCAHLAETAPFAAGHLVDTVYFGGGTPSYLGTKRLVKILKTILKNTRWTSRRRSPWRPIPTPPGTGKSCAPCAGAGSTASPWECSPPMTKSSRRSAGCTPWLRRKPPWRPPRKAKFQNLSLDLIYGLPHQTLEGGRKTFPLPWT